MRVLADGSDPVHRARAGAAASRPAAGFPGAYNVANALLACAILAEAGVDVAAVAPAVAAAQVRGRMERVDGDQPFLAVVDYSHKPAGVAGALQALRPLTAGRLIVVLGCGGDRDRGKRPVMGEVAAARRRRADRDRRQPAQRGPGRDPGRDAGRRPVGAGRAGPPRSSSRATGGRAIEQAIALAGPGDTVLIAGKGHETGQEVGGHYAALR